MRSRILMAATLAIGLSFVGVGDAEAGWGCYGVSTGCYGVSTGCYGVSSGCHGCYGSVVVSCHGCYGYDSCHGCYGVHMGPFRRLAARMHAHHAACSCYGGCYGGCYSSCHGCYSSCHGCYSSCYGSKVIYDSSPVQQSIEAPQPAPAADPLPATPPPVESTQLLRGRAELVVEVPADAKIYVNGNKTNTQGTHRRYLSAGLIPGQTYVYEVQAVFERDGKEQAVTKSISLTAGSEVKLAFDFPATEQVETVLTLHVPADAKVNLAGNETEKTGSTRVFTTARLAPGQVWDGYQVQVTWSRDGQEITKEKTVTLRGGEAQELSFEFSESLVASN
ncbi:MAG: TIGR03000 domain-containing protein [Planctomycetia bacterium]|nr:TIGR03000 domain-containing protein [Planctomycetia bacterium]